MTYPKKLARIFLIFSIVIFFYFSLLVYWSYYPPESTGVIRFFGELLTIPLLLMLVVNLISSIVFVFLNKYRKINIIIFTLSLATTILLFEETF